MVQIDKSWRNFRREDSVSNHQQKLFCDFLQFYLKEGTMDVAGGQIRNLFSSKTQQILALERRKWECTFSVTLPKNNFSLLLEYRRFNFEPHISNFSFHDSPWNRWSFGNLHGGAGVAIMGYSNIVHSWSINSGESWRVLRSLWTDTVNHCICLWL